MTKPSKWQAAGTSAALSVLFLVTYNACNWITSQRRDVGVWYYSWERFIPFVPLLIVPYMSIDLFFVGGPFLCQTRDELQTLTRRIVWAIVIATTCFLLFPLQLAVPRPQPQGWTASWFQFLYGFDRPHNLFPSLHIALRTILAELYARHTRGPVRVASHAWFSLIGFSTLLTYQHHFIDVAGGFLLGLACCYALREPAPRAEIVPNFRIAAWYGMGTILVCLAAGLGWPWTVILLWPGMSLAIVTTAYLGVGPAIYGKRHGRIPWSTSLLLGPCLLGQRLSRRYYRRQCEPYNAVKTGLWLGRHLTEAEARAAVASGVTAVLDLTAEFTAPAAFRAINYLNLPVMDLTGMTAGQLSQAVAFIETHSRTGIVYVHCKVGYSRSAMAVGAYLLHQGHAAHLRAVLDQLRTVRKPIIIRPEAIASLQAWAERQPRPTPAATAWATAS